MEWFGWLWTGVRGRVCREVCLGNWVFGDGDGGWWKVLRVLRVRFRIKQKDEEGKDGVYCAARLSKDSWTQDLNLSGLSLENSMKLKDEIEKMMESGKAVFNFYV